MIYGYIDYSTFATQLDHRKNVLELSGRYVLVEGHQERYRDCDRRRDHAHLLPLKDSNNIFYKGCFHEKFLPLAMEREFGGKKAEAL